LIIGLTIFWPIPLKNWQQKDTPLVCKITYHSVSITHSLSTPHLKFSHNTSLTPPNSLVLAWNTCQVHITSYPTFIQPSTLCN
jgi:hypothetical protein